MLNPYARGGQYERFFEGRNNIDFANDFVVIENEELKRRPDLHAVVNILAAAPDHRRDVPDAQPAQGALHRRTQAAARRHRRRRPGQGRRGGRGGPARAQVRRIAGHRHPERRRLLRLGADGGRLQLLGLGIPAAPEARVHRDARPQGASVDGRAEEAAAEFAAHRARCVLRGLHLLACGRRRGAQHPRSGHAPAVLQQAGGQRAHRRTARAGPGHR